MLCITHPLVGALSAVLSPRQQQPPHCPAPPTAVVAPPAFNSTAVDINDDNNDDPSFDASSSTSRCCVPPLLRHHPRAPLQRLPLPVPGLQRWPRLRPGRTPSKPGRQCTRHPHGRRSAGSRLMPLTAPHAVSRNSSLCGLPWDCHHSHVYMGATSPAASQDARSAHKGGALHLRDKVRVNVHVKVWIMGCLPLMPMKLPRHLGDGSPWADVDTPCPPRSACRTNGLVWYSWLEDLL